MIDLVYLENKHHFYPNVNYFDVIYKYDQQIQTLGINYNKPHNPLYMHMMLYTLYYLFSNETISRLALPKDAQLLCVLGLISQHRFNPTDMWAGLTEGSPTEQHYKLWRYFFTTLMFTNSPPSKPWKEIEHFLMFSVDFSFYLDDAFHRNILLMSIYDFLLCGIKHHFDFTDVMSFMRKNCDDFFEYLTKSLLWIEGLKVSRIQGSPFNPLPEASFLMTAARLKIKPEHIDEFVRCLREHQYHAALERAFFQPSDPYKRYLVM